MIRLDVTREDGEVTRLRGESALAACMGPIADAVELSDPPMVSVRCGNEEELAWNLAALMAAVRHLSPAAFEQAGQLMKLCNFDRPQLQRKLPPRGGRRS